MNGQQEQRQIVLLETLAELEHKQWQSWALTIFDSEELSELRKARWKDTLFREYHELTEDQKSQDREWAEQVLWAVKKHMRIK